MIPEGETSISRRQWELVGLFILCYSPILLQTFINVKYVSLRHKEKRKKYHLCEFKDVQSRYHFHVSKIKVRQ